MIHMYEEEKSCTEAELTKPYDEKGHSSQAHKRWQLYNCSATNLFLFITHEIASFPKQQSF